MTDSINSIAEARVGAWVKQHERATAKAVDHHDPELVGLDGPTADTLPKGGQPLQPGDSSRSVPAL